MIVDTRTHAAPLNENFDLCIIGAGAAGITLALELCSLSKQRVALIESGGFQFNLFAQSHYVGEVRGDRHPSLYRARYSGVGGSTELWAGWCRPLDKLDFEQRSWIAESGWPIARADLDSHYAKATAWCGLGPRGYEPQEWSVPFDGESLQDNGDLSDRLFRVRRMQFKSEYHTRLEKSRDVILFTHATTLRLFTGDNHELVDSIGLHLGNGHTTTLQARRFVLASGGLENPRLLLLSGDSPAQAIGNQHDRVGRYYNEHGFVDSGWFHASTRQRQLRHYFPVLHPDGAQFGTARNVLTLKAERLQKEKLNNAAIYFHPAYEAHSVFDQDSVKAALELWQIVKKRAIEGNVHTLVADAASGPHHVFHAACRKALVRNQLQQDWRLRCYFECAPNAGNRVELGIHKDDVGRPRLRVTWSLGEDDLNSVERFHECVDSELRQHDLGHLSFPRGADEWRRKTETGKHLMGATRMHASPSLGVVDKDCLVHGTNNLFIVGSSVFPATGYANPTLTIVALAVRLAAHLAQLK